MVVRNGVLCADIGENEKQEIIKILTEKVGACNLIDFSSPSELIRVAISWLMTSPPTKEELIDLAVHTRNTQNFTNFINSQKTKGGNTK